jgi:hypothetical protein
LYLTFISTYCFFVKREATSKNMVSTVQACAKEHDITLEQATEKLRELIEEAWMDITKECLTQPAAEPPVGVGVEPPTAGTTMEPRQSPPQVQEDEGKGVRRRKKAAPP